MRDYSIERYEHTMKLDEYVERYVNYSFTELECSKCSSYDYKWTCPPFDFDVKDIWTGYDNIKLILLKIIFTDEFKDKKLDYDDFKEYSRKLFQYEKMQIYEEMIDEEERLNGLYLTCGPCALCSVCTRYEGKACRMPDKMRYSMESLGTNVISTSQELFNIKPQWITNYSKPDYHIFLNAILY